MMVLQETSEKKYPSYSRVSRESYNVPGFEKGAPKRANKIGLIKPEEKQGKANMPDM